MKFILPGEPFSGIARPFPYSHFDAYRDWVGRGFHGDMTYLARVHSRESMESLLPGVRSVLAFAFPYPFDPRQALKAPSKDAFKIAQYAHGEDYHKRIRRHLKAVAKALPGSFRLCCDSGRLMEKETAAAAGLGFIGKHTLLIHPGHGSAVMLGFILTTAELEPTPVKGFRGCGWCQRCLSVCPTGALVAPYTLDARRCISYLTMESKTPPEDAPATRWGYIYGCDLCQAVCPCIARPVSMESPSPTPDLERVSPVRLEQNKALASGEKPGILVEQDGLQFPLNPTLKRELTALIGRPAGQMEYDGLEFRMLERFRPAADPESFLSFFRRTQLVDVRKPFRFMLKT